MLAPEVITWASSDVVAFNLVDSIQRAHTIDRLGLILLALLSHKRILNGEPDNGFEPWLRDFDSLLRGARVQSETQVLEHMMHSILRNFAALDIYKHISEFISRGLGIKAPVLGSMDGFSDRYWIRRSKGATHDISMKEHWVQFDIQCSQSSILASQAASADVMSHCEHPSYRGAAQGFKPSKVLVEIQVFDLFFTIDRDSLGTSWAGRWLLLRSGCWIEALMPCWKRNGIKRFRLVDAPGGVCVVEGNTCPDRVEFTSAEFMECALGQILVAEKTGSWAPFFAFIWWHLVRYLAKLVHCVTR
jgi:hypothetical protein